VACFFICILSNQNSDHIQSLLLHLSDFFIDIFFFVFFIWSHFYNDCIRFSGFVQKTISRFARNTQETCWQNE